jgi:hypothetical protein
MNALLELHIAPNRLYRINSVPTYLQVECLSEICNTLGTGPSRSLARKSPKQLKTAFCGQINRVPTKNHGANGARR